MKVMNCLLKSNGFRMASNWDAYLMLRISYLYFLCVLQDEEVNGYLRKGSGQGKGKGKGEGKGAGGGEGEGESEGKGKGKGKGEGEGEGEGENYKNADSTIYVTDDIDDLLLNP